MSNKRIKELRNLTQDELASRERELRANLFQAKMKLATGTLDNASSVWQMRKDLARVKMLRAETKPAQKAAR